MTEIEDIKVISATDRFTKRLEAIMQNFHNEVALEDAIK